MGPGTHPNYNQSTLQGWAPFTCRIVCMMPSMVLAASLTQGSDCQIPQLPPLDDVSVVPQEYPSEGKYSGGSSTLSEVLRASCCLFRFFLSFSENEVLNPVGGRQLAFKGRPLGPNHPRLATSDWRPTIVECRLSRRNCQLSRFKRQAQQMRYKSNGRNHAPISFVRTCSVSLLGGGDSCYWPGARQQLQL